MRGSTHRLGAVAKRRADKASAGSRPLSFFLVVMPAGIKDDALWQKAKNALKQSWDTLENPWAAVMAKYKDLGGEASKEAEEACASGAMAQLMRGKEAVSMAGAENYISLREAKINRSARTITSILISEGCGNMRTRNFYTAEFIQDAAVKYNGARAYLNHASEAEYNNRPEGDIRELCGYYKNLSVTMIRDKQTGEMVKAVLGDLVFDESAAGDEGLAKAEAQIEYSRIFPDTTEEYCGLSICGSGKPGGQIDIAGQKWNRIVGVGKADSVDVVTRPARGGAFLALTESAGTLPHLSKEESTMIKDSMAILAQINTVTEKLAEAKTDAERATFKGELQALNKKLKEAAAKKDEEADDEDMSALKKLMPKDSDEADDVYEDRMKKIKAAAKGKESKTVTPSDISEAIASMSADDFRKKQPKLFEAIASRVRESQAEQGEDLKAVKAELREARIKLAVADDTKLATKLLTEAGVPAKFLSVGDLLGKTEEEMRREIERTQAMLAEAGGPTRIPSGGPVAKGSKLDAAINKLVEAAAA